MKIIQICPVVKIADRVEVYGLGDDNNAYRWRSGKWDLVS